MSFGNNLIIAHSRRLPDGIFTMPCPKDVILIEKKHTI